MSAPPAVARRSAGARLRRVARRHPEWWAVVLAASAWVALVVLALLPAPVPTGMPGMPDMPAHAHHAGPGVGHVAVMAVAMMVPLVLGHLQDVALASFRRRRYRAQVMFLAGYLAVWIPVALLLTVAVRAAASVAGDRVVLAAVAAVAVVWQFGRWKRRVLRWCSAGRVPAAHGWHADVSCLRRGVRVAVPCVGTCGPLMAVAAAAGHGVLAMATLTAVAVYERVTRVPDPRVGAVVTAGVAAVVLTVGF